jgi:hypothetical protein
MNKDNNQLKAYMFTDIGTHYNSSLPTLMRLFE